MDAWLGTLFLKALPVAVAPAGLMGLDEQSMARLVSIVERVEPRSIVCGQRSQKSIREGARPEVSEITITPEDLRTGRRAAGFRMPKADREETAYLQLTSGSTGTPRAVMVSHRAAIQNVLALDDAIGSPLSASAQESIDTIISWLPQYHDMGLIGCLCYSFICGYELVMLPPQAFLARPRLWLEHLGRAGGTMAGSPSFAYQHCADRLKDSEIEQLDLAGWQAAMIGAEMVRTEVVEGFVDRFEGCGFRRGTFRPCYGLAEASLVVTMDRFGQGSRTRPAPAGSGAEFGLSEIVSSGAPVMETEVRTTAPDARVLADGEVGEIRIKGEGLFNGYYNQPEATARCFQDGWLRTGDLGFLLEGELYVTGRLKDLLIIHGQNLMPHELERVAKSFGGGPSAHRTGAFSIARGAEGEEIVLVSEVAERDPEALAAIERAIRVGVGRTFSLPVADVLLVPPGTIPVTTSGKVRRSQLRKNYLESKLRRMDRG